MLIGVVEDDENLQRQLDDVLRGAGHDVFLVADGSSALCSFGTDSGVEAMVVDVDLPDSDGRDVCRTLRASGQHAPVLFLTDRTGAHDRLDCFSVGGDDVLVKPFDLREALVRVDALARRGKPALSTIPGLVLDPAVHAVRAGLEEALLTPTEFRVLAAITAHRDGIVPRETVVAAGWPSRDGVVENTVDSFIRRVRAKLVSIDAPVVIETVRGVGFRLERSALLSSSSASA